jgi:hypothetical protein
VSDALSRFRVSLLAKRESLERLGAVAVDPVRFIDSLLEELRTVAARDEDLLSLTEAARHCGYSADHLGTLVRAGQLNNYGRRNAPRVKLSELPRKPGGLTANSPGANVRMQIAREVAHSAPGRGNAQA